MTVLKITRPADGWALEVPTGAEFGVDVALGSIGEAVQLRRTISGKLVNVGDPAFRKYTFGVSANGLRLPALEGLWEGDELTVECPVLIRERGATPSRPAVADTVRVEGPWVEYRPVFTMMLVGRQFSESEGKAAASWSLDLEEL